VRWPPHLTPLEFLFIWGTIKHNKVYQEPPTKPEEMQQRIIAASAAVTLQTLQSVNHSLTRQFQKCIKANGHHSEYLLL
jgi:hypothetical protein